MTSAAAATTVASTPTLTVSTVAVAVPKEVTALSSSLTATLVQSNGNKSSSGTSRVLSDDNHPSLSDLPATKVTAKGLSPQQFQLIERLFKNSKNLTSTASNGATKTTNSASPSISLATPNPRASSLDVKKTEVTTSHTQVIRLN